MLHDRNHIGSLSSRPYWREQGVAAYGGGFPIKVDGEVVGAIGLSGAPTVQNDEDCARAALALLPDGVPG